MKSIIAEAKISTVLKAFGVLFIVCTLMLFFGCEGPALEGDGLTVLCADFSEYDWMTNILGDNPGNVKLELLNETGTDMHSFQPTVKDMRKLADADLLIYTDGISQFWITDALGEYGEKRFFSLMEEFIHNEEYTEGYELDEHDHDHESDHDRESDHDHEAEHDHETDHEHHDAHIAQEHHHEHHDHEADEHLHLSLRLAAFFTEDLGEEMAVLDPGNSEYYFANAEAYAAELLELHEEFKEKLSGDKRPILVADRFPFTYLFQDYGLECFAAFSGCSAETEASFETIVELADAMKENKLKYAALLESSDSALAETVMRAADIKGEILILNSLQSVSADDIQNGTTYLKAMKTNLEVLEKLCLN